MKNFILEEENINKDQLESRLLDWLNSLAEKPEKVLLLPPDYSRINSKAGLIVQLLYQLLTPECEVKILPALGTHDPMSQEELESMFGEDIPADCFIAHRWREDIEKAGEIPGDFVSEVSGGLVDFKIDVQVNKELLDESYDLIVSIGQIVPHEVVGMANYTKNIVVGCGGSDFINKSHFLGAVYGMEKIMGRDHSPVREVFDYAEEKILNRLPLNYIFTVVGPDDGKDVLKGLYIGKDREIFERAVTLSQQINLELLEQPLENVVVYLKPEKFNSTWIGNKAIYRTRMAIAEGGNLYVIAPGVKMFGEDPIFDKLIRKYGYRGRKQILKLTEEEEELKENLSASAHLIHGSSEGRFNIYYSPGHLSQEEIEQVNYNYLPLAEARERFKPEELKPGYNTLEDGEEIYFIDNPALSLWGLKDDFETE